MIQRNVLELIRLKGVYLRLAIALTGYKSEIIVLKVSGIRQINIYTSWRVDRQERVRIVAGPFREKERET